MKFRSGLFFSLLFLIFISGSKNLFASTSLFNVPTTETLKKGEFEIKFKNQKRINNADFEDTLSLKYAALKRFEIGASSVLNKGSQTEFSCKYRFLDEKNGWPSFAAGIDKIKFEIPSNFYLVGTKEIGNFKLSIGEYVNTNSGTLMGGFEVPVCNKLLFMADYTNKSSWISTIGFCYKFSPRCNIKLGYGFTSLPQNNLLNLQFAIKGNLFE